MCSTMFLMTQVRMDGRIYKKSVFVPRTIISVHITYPEPVSTFIAQALSSILLFPTCMLVNYINIDCSMLFCMT